MIVANNEFTMYDGLPCICFIFNRRKSLLNNGQKIRRLLKKKRFPGEKNK